jgi:L-threonylcarbamoyladenylate synthase
MSNFDNDIQASVTKLNNGKLILYPTDTIWGIGCDATNGDAVKKIYALKNREEKKSLIILVANENMIGQYVSKPSTKLLSYISSSKKPTTAIFKNAIHLPPQLVNEDGSIAIRIPKDEFCLRLIEKFGKPLVSTSANISGEKFPQNFNDVSEKIKNGVDYIVQHRQNDYSKNAPSSIIKINDQDEIEIIR